MLKIDRINIGAPIFDKNGRAKIEFYDSKKVFDPRSTDVISIPLETTKKQTKNQSKVKTEEENEK